MTSRTSFSRGLMAVTAAALLAVSLAACSSDSPGGDLGAPPVDLPSSIDVNIGGDLPAGFPADDVPLIDGDIITAGGTAEEGIWIVNVRSTDSVDEARTEAAGLLTAAGYTQPDDMAGSGVYTNGTYTIVIRAVPQNGATVVNYSIATKR